MYNYWGLYAIIVDCITTKPLRQREQNLVQTIGKLQKSLTTKSGLNRPLFLQTSIKI